MNHGDCELNIPYPPIEVEGKNKRYAQLLLKDYSGSKGELTALTQYFYQYLITKHKYSDLANELRCISIVEMKHMEMLGELIVLLGENPFPKTFDLHKNTYWCSNNISSIPEIKKFLFENIKSENTAIKNYKQRIAQIDDSKIQAILKRIIKDEENHIKIFTKYLAKFS